MARTWSVQIVLKQGVGKIPTGVSAQLPIAVGSHTFQLYVPKLLDGRSGLVSAEPETVRRRPC